MYDVIESLIKKIAIANRELLAVKRVDSVKTYVSQHNTIQVNNVFFS